MLDRRDLLKLGPLAAASLPAAASAETSAPAAPPGPENAARIIAEARRIARPGAG
jgi:hypothetical protein